MIPYIRWKRKLDRSDTISSAYHHAIKWYSEWFNCIIECNILACKYCFTIQRSKEWSGSFLSQLLICSRLTVAIEWAWSKWPKTSWLDEHLWPYTVILYHSVYRIQNFLKSFANKWSSQYEVRRTDSDQGSTDRKNVTLLNGSLLVKVFELRILKKFYG